MNNFVQLFQIYKRVGLLVALWTVLRVFILPFSRIDKLVNRGGRFVDIGCGNGGLTHYLVLSSPRRKGIGIDFSKGRIIIAKSTISGRKNINFVQGDATSHSLPKSRCYLLVDVLHHIPYPDQKKLLQTIIKQMDRKSSLIIKDVDKNNVLPFLFGHLWEKILYPKENIFVRGKSDWANLLSSFKLKWTIEYGNFYFPDSTLIFKVTKVKR